MSRNIYKILTKQEFKSFLSEGIFSGSKLDKRDGYIHLSSNELQYTRVRNKYYAEHDKVHLLHINSAKLSNLRYETTSSGDIYPHQYGSLKISDVIKVEEISGAPSSPVPPSQNRILENVKGVRGSEQKKFLKT